MTASPDPYIHGHSDSVLRSHRWRTAENSAAYLLPHLADGMRLLDVGCGPGTLTVDLAARVGTGEVVGVDVSEAVLAEAAAHAGEEKAGNVTFRAGDFRALDFPAGSFDVVHAHQVLQHLRDPVGASSEQDWWGERRTVWRSEDGYADDVPLVPTFAWFQPVNTRAAAYTSVST